ncbi:GNAT family N-acetyltransferase [Catellatospora tritici]|uniref:GNAT family N-acetyltransferase n=1 Tax=Catellatospora tritici TaxID=2851566 RepID=UPI001C2DDD23|nr:GNAT family N-acetyltransferase [Catellatospora tritici]MBV1853760.1 GNAT family N-acetyltransferase [Catellatospora tritici]
MPELITPNTALHQAWLDCRDDWGRDVIQHGSGLRQDEDVDTLAGFTVFVDRMKRMSDESIPVAEGLVHATYWWIADRGEIVGSISLRHRLNDFLLHAGGHIGYGVRPSARKRGLASWALGEVLGHARARGLDRALVTCDDTNIASARTIERNGGVLEDIRHTELGYTRRYWIDLTAA